MRSVIATVIMTQQYIDVHQISKANLTFAQTKTLPKIWSTEKEFCGSHVPVGHLVKN